GFNPFTLFVPIPLPGLPPGLGPNSNQAQFLELDPNIPGTSFDARVPQSGMEEALANELEVPFVTLNLFYRLYREVAANNETLDAQAVAIASALAGAFADKWPGEAADKGHVRAVLDGNDYTEIFRRLPGFLAIVTGMLRPLLGTDPTGTTPASVTTMNRLIQHLNCNRNYYIQRYITYLAQT